MGVDDVLKVILLLIGFCALLFLTYVTTRYVGGKHNKAMKGRNISVLETVPLGMDKRLHLVKAGNTHVLIASTSKTVEFLTVVTLENPVPEQGADPGSMGEQQAKPATSSWEDGSPFDFRSLFDKYIGVYKTKKDHTDKIHDDGQMTDMPGNRDFRINLDRLKKMIQKNEIVQENGDDNTNEK